MSFQFFDPEAEVLVTHRLPHWEQAGATYFITFRTADSLPAKVMKGWENDRDNWLRRHKINPASESWQERLLELTTDEQREFHQTFTKRWHEMLDDCHGECVLRRAELSQIVADSFHFFDGERYSLGDFVVMPNHVHLLVMFPSVHKLQLQCRSWKKFAAGQINERLGRHGQFWQAESFDHLVRSPEQFEYFRTYIAENPVKARLQPGEYLRYRCPK